MNIGIFGVGSFGEKHINVLKTINDFNIVGFFDPDKKRQKYIEKKYRIKAYSTPNKLIKDCDAIDIVSNAKTHYELIELGIQYKKHIFVEKPICITKKEVTKLLEYKRNYQSIIQVGHIERYNPVVTKELIELNDISSIEAVRIGELNHRNEKIPITLDLMIHDIDLILNMINSEIADIKASGLKGINRKTLEDTEMKNYDQASCKIIFKNGKTAWLNSKRLPNNLKTGRWMNIHCSNQEISINFLDRIVEWKKEKKIWKEQEFNQDANPLKEEFLDFKKSIQQKIPPIVGVEEGCKAVNIALKMEDIMKKSLHKNFEKFEKIASKTRYKLKCEKQK